jgi:hypothetical protein
MHRIAILISIVVLLAGPARAESPADGAEVSFRNDAMAVLAKAGCSAGACHGNKNGKGGFKLSLRGQDPDDDFATLTRDLLGRRVNPVEPEHSLILLKATGQVPHEGGVRFRADSAEYRILRQWIEDGARRDGVGTPTLVGLEVTPTEKVLVEPEEGVRIAATAVFSDGRRRDVSGLAVYEQSAEVAKIAPDGGVRRQRFGETTVIVRYLHLQQPVRLTFVAARPDFTWAPTAVNNYVDEHVLAKLRTLRINPSGPATDHEFVRRAYLDLLGVLPTAEEARSFVANATPGKRAKLIDRLLERPEYADFWALKWSDVLRNEERALDRKGVQNFHQWIRRSVAENKPLDQFVREILAARGSTYTNPPTNYYRANRDPVVRGEGTAQLFLGVRLQCAQCHNHPFDRWTQDDYYGWADVFGRIDYRLVENNRRDRNDKHEFVGEQVVFEAKEGGIKDPRGGDRKVRPMLLGADEAVPDDASRLDALAAWVTSPQNAYFAKAQVNRIWFHLMGRGIVDPVDDFRATNPPSHPELLDALAADFVANGYDVKHVIRTVMASAAYGASSTPNETNADDEANYARATPRRLSAEQLLDAQHQVTGVAAEFAGYPKGMRAAQIPGVRAARARDRRATSADTFLTTFGKPARELACECERTSETTLGQAFQLIGGPGVSKLLGEAENRLGQLLKSGASDESIVDELYWVALSRPPTADEAGAMVAHVKAAGARRKGLEDVAWALLNAKEFVLRR